MSWDDGRAYSIPQGVGTLHLAKQGKRCSVAEVRTESGGPGRTSAVAEVKMGPALAPRSLGKWVERFSRYIWFREVCPADYFA